MLVTEPFGFAVFHDNGEYRYHFPCAHTITMTARKRATNGRELKSSNHQQSNWQRCSRGQLSQLVKRKRDQQQLLNRRRFLAGTTAAGFLAVTGITSYSLLLNELNELKPATEIAYTCAEVKEFVDPYFEGSLSDEVVGKIDQHLANCQKCQRIYDERSNSVA